MCAATETTRTASPSFPTGRRTGERGCLSTLTSFHLGGEKKQNTNSASAARAESGSEQDPAPLLFISGHTKLNCYFLVQDLMRLLSLYVFMEATTFIYFFFFSAFFCQFCGLNAAQVLSLQNSSL